MGTSGADRLAGGLGRDVLTGGKGRDTFVFGNGDTVADFKVGKDKVDLSALGVTENNFASMVSVSKQGKDVVLSVGDQTMVLNHVKMGKLLNSDSFVFATQASDAGAAKGALGETSAPAIAPTHALDDSFILDFSGRDAARAFAPLAAGVSSGWAFDDSWLKIDWTKIGESISALTSNKHDASIGQVAAVVAVAPAMPDDFILSASSLNFASRGGDMSLPTLDQSKGSAGEVREAVSEIQSAQSVNFDPTGILDEHGAHHLSLDFSHFNFL
jgi:hypothetical protein